MAAMKLHDYFRSSACYRVRIALGLKGLRYEQTFVNLREREQAGEGYRQVNPAGLVPTLEDDAGRHSQSLAIVEYLEERYPEPPLLPPDAAGRARVRALALAVACDIHPLNNLRVLRYLKDALQLDEPARDAWYAHWIATGLSALEAELARDRSTGRHCHGDTPGLADLCLVPQVYNAERMKCDLGPYPVIRRLVAAARELPAFQAAEPSRQPDAVA
jgi:maleylpyruvate isomerase